MLRLIINHLKQTKRMASLFVIAFIVIFALLPIALHAIQDTNKSIETDITYYARGAYDILVRPQNSIQAMEKELGVVPQNYVGAYTLALITVAESISSIMIAIKVEVSRYKAIGWRLKDIFKLYFTEIALWTGAALVIGSCHLCYFLSSSIGRVHRSLDHFYRLISNYFNHCCLHIKKLFEGECI